MSLWEEVDKAKEVEFQALPEGVFTAEITDVEVKDDFMSASYKVTFTISQGDFTGRKVWWSGTLTPEKLSKNPNIAAMVKGQICRMAGVDSTEGKPMELLAEQKGAVVLIDVKHSPNPKNPDKPFTNVFVKERLG